MHGTLLGLCVWDCVSFAISAAHFCVDAYLAATCAFGSEETVGSLATGRVDDGHWYFADPDAERVFDDGANPHRARIVSM